MKIAAVLAICAACLAARQPLEPPVRVTIRVLNSARVPDPLLGQSKRMVDHILNTAGVQTTWVDCDAPDRPCSGPPRAAELLLQLLKDRPGSLEPDTAGYALLVPDCTGCGYAAVSYAAVQAVARDWDGDAATLLGATVAHEIGHLLLGAQSHTKDGVMSARFRREHFNQAGRGTLLFMPDQAQRLRAGVRERLLASRLP